MRTRTDFRQEQLVDVASWAIDINRAAYNKTVYILSRRLVCCNMSNPFLFFVQHLLFGISSEAGAQQNAPRLVIAAAKTEDGCAQGPTLATNQWWISFPGRSASTEQHLRIPPTSYRFSGHVGWSASSMPNRFLFLHRSVTIIPISKPVIIV